MTKNNTIIDYNTKSYFRQLVLPLDYEHSIEADCPVRLLDAVLEGLDYKKLHANYSTKDRKSSIPPEILFKLVIWGIMNDATSIRRLYKESRYNLQALWLLRGYTVGSHMVLGRFFAKLTIPVIEDLFRQLIEALQNIDTLPFSEVYIDGTKLEANANRYSFKWKRFIEKYLKKTQDKLDAVRNDIVTQLDIPAHEYTDDELLAKLESIVNALGIQFVYGSGKRKHTLQRLSEKIFDLRMKKLGYQNDLAIMGERNSYAKTDPDATFMRMKEDHMLNGQLKPGYNLQIAVASEYIVHLGIFPNPNDTKTLIPFLESFKRIYNCFPDKVVADAGYYSEKNLHWLHAMTVQSVIKSNLYEVSKTRKYQNDIGRAENMTYCAETDTFTCKAGKTLKHVHNSNKHYKEFISTYKIYHCDECNGCEYRRECQRCTKDKLPNSGKTIRIAPEKTRRLQDENLERLTSKEGILLRQNRSIQVEGVFAQMKQNAGKRRLSRRGQLGVYLEMMLFAMAFNITKLHNRMQNGRIGQQYFCAKNLA